VLDGEQVRLRIGTKGIFGMRAIRAVLGVVAAALALSVLSYGAWWLFYGRPDIPFWIWSLIMFGTCGLVAMLDRSRAGLDS
jgi:hypothetical protein